jgi:hypothetical protein
MLMMSPHGRSSWRSPPSDKNEDVVDPTEPRLETFTRSVVQMINKLFSRRSIVYLVGAKMPLARVEED